MIVSGSRLFSGLKARPKRYKASGAAFATGGNRGGYIAWLPRPYPRTSQQKKVASIARECGIKAGISKADLQTKMIDCVGPKMAK